VDFRLSEDQLALQGVAAEFFASLGGPERSRQALTTGAPVADVRAELAQLDLLGLLVPVAAGGGGGTVLDLAVAAEQSGRFVVPDPLVGTSARAMTLLADAAADDGTDLLARGVKGAIGLSVLDGGDLTVADDTVTGTGVASLQAAGADAYLLHVTRTDGTPLVVAVEDPAHVSVPAEVPVDPSRALGRPRFDRAAATTVLAGESAETAWQRARDLAVIVLAAQDLGTITQARRSSVEYAKDREAFGRQIGSFQAIKHTLVDLYVREEQLRSLVWLAAWSADVDPGRTGLYAAAASAYAKDTLSLAAKTVVHVHGGTGFTWEHDAHLYWRRAKTDRALFATAADQRAAVARWVLNEEEQGEDNA
jgi:alkylation response protein AidB-like acyl-CoA dehydrogenase